MVLHFGAGVKVIARGGGREGLTSPVSRVEAVGPPSAGKRSGDIWGGESFTSRGVLYKIDLLSMIHVT